MGDKIDVAKQYIKARLAEDIPTILGLVTDDIVLESQRDGTHTGKEAFEAYLKKTKPTGKWQDPEADGDKVVIKGSVTVMFIPFSVISIFEFSSDGKISKIEIKKA